MDILKGDLERCCFAAEQRHIIKAFELKAGSWSHALVSCLNCSYFSFLLAIVRLYEH